MRLRNKKTGEIGELTSFVIDELIAVWVENKSCPEYRYNSLADLNEEWEDYEEPKGTALYWMILTLENFIENEPDDKWVDLEDCKQMLEKLKAWERLKDMITEVRITRYNTYNRKFSYSVDFGFIDKEDEDLAEISRDINLLFGGEE